MLECSVPDVFRCVVIGVVIIAASTTFERSVATILARYMAARGTSTRSIVGLDADNLNTVVIGLVFEILTQPVESPAMLPRRM